MSEGFRLSDGDRDIEPGGVASSADRELKNFCYVVASVNEDALTAWADLWRQLKDGVTPAGMVLPELQQGFEPACGWVGFLEKFWLLKHYLDYTHRICMDARASL